MVDVCLHPALFGEKERLFLNSDGVKVSLFRYDTGVAAVRLANERGYTIVLPYLGQMLWDANFDGVRLGMGHRYPAPRPAKVISETYGCLAFHSGLLRNGSPSPADTHQLHGEFPCAALESATLEVDSDGRGAFVRLAGRREHIDGFTSHYLARPSVTMRPGNTLLEIGMAVENCSDAPMDLMYNCHINFAFVEGGRILQAAEYTPENVSVRTAVPEHVKATPAYLKLLDDLGVNPGLMASLDPSLGFDPEQVFYLSSLGCDEAGRTHVMLRRPEGDGFAVSFSPAEFPHPTRWLLRNKNVQAAGIALPATCRPEGYLAEQRANRVRSLASGAGQSFHVGLGYLDQPAAERLESTIRRLTSR
jgi:hypothetical protein